MFPMIGQQIEILWSVSSNIYHLFVLAKFWRTRLAQFMLQFCFDKNQKWWLDIVHYIYK